MRMSNTEQLITEIETLLLKRINIAKRFRDQANAEKQKTIATRWDERASTYRDALVGIRGIASDFHSLHNADRIIA